MHRMRTADVSRLVCLLCAVIGLRESISAPSHLPIRSNKTNSCDMRGMDNTMDMDMDMPMHARVTKVLSVLSPQKSVLSEMGKANDHRTLTRLRLEVVPAKSNLIRSNGKRDVFSCLYVHSLYLCIWRHSPITYARP